MAFPFIISASLIIMILDDQKLSKTIAFTSVSIGLLGMVIGVVCIDVIMLDNYMSNNITVKSLTKFYENLNLRRIFYNIRVILANFISLIF